MEIDSRPWGLYEVLHDGPTCKVKRILVKSGCRLSLQSHAHRSESWTVVSGTAVVTLDSSQVKLGVGDNIRIKKGQKHRVENSQSETLIFIEVQTGDYFGEDDIIRYEDDYGRIDEGS